MSETTPDERLAELANFKEHAWLAQGQRDAGLDMRSIAVSKDADENVAFAYEVDAGLCYLLRREGAPTPSVYVAVGEHSREPLTLHGRNHAFESTPIIVRNDSVETLVDREAKLVREWFRDDRHGRKWSGDVSGRMLNRLRDESKPG